MGKQLVVVGSSIQPKSGSFTYSPTRSFFSPEERFRQTIFTINSLRLSLPNAKIVILDTSEDYKDYTRLTWFFDNVEYVPLKELSEEAFKIANNHPNKSVCESVLLNTYYKSRRKEILEYDTLIKATGRYFYYGLTEASLSGGSIFFKKPLQFEWNDHWRYQFVDRREEQGDNLLHQYCTVLYAFDTKLHLSRFIDLNETAIHLMNQQNMKNYDIETLSYFMTRPMRDQIREIEQWRVCGWDGVSGRFMYY